MSTIKMNWGARIALLYGGFVVLIVVLVTKSMREDFDLVSTDYYNKELAYQNVIEAGKNQATLSEPVKVYKDGSNVTIDFPAEFDGAVVEGNIQFYSKLNAKWDRSIPVAIDEQGNCSIPVDKLVNTIYTVKMDWRADGKTYYQETELNLAK